MTADSTTTMPAHNGHAVPRRRRRGLLITLGATVLLAFGYLAVSAFTDSVVYYRTPTEAASLTGEHVRLSGSVVAGSIAPAGEDVSFVVTDGTTQVTVHYAGTRPTALRDGGDVVADGVVGPGGTFQATSLVTKCPSKFDSKDGATGE